MIWALFKHDIKRDVNGNNKHYQCVPVTCRGCGPFDLADGLARRFVGSVRGRSGVFDRGPNWRRAAAGRALFGQRRKSPIGARRSGE